MTKEEFIKKAQIIHSGESIDYSFVEYKNNRTKVKLIDPIYGEFWQTPSNHLKGQSHPKRRNEKISISKRSAQDEIIKRFQKKHEGENLDYSKVEYVNMHTKVCIIDPLYGEYWQEPCAHLKGCIHPQRAIQKVSESNKYTNEQFKELCHRIHPSYILDKVEYEDSQKKVIIICPKHGEFMGTPDALLQGKGCPKCGNHLSRGEDEIYEYIKCFMGDKNVIKGDKKVLGGLEIDILVPSKQIGFEFDGLRWHSEKYKNKYYHLNKTELCKKNGIMLIHIFEDEWLCKKEIVLNKIKHILGFDEGKKIGARKCSIEKIDKGEAKEFLDENHIQGYAKSTKYFGAFFENNLVGVMTFLKEKDGFILNRFATNRNYIIQGLFSKMLTYFIRNYSPKKIETFLDRRWCYTNNNVYSKFGMQLEYTIKPNYSYTNGKIRKHKFSFRKKILHKKYGLPLSMTELEMTKELGYDRIWDCGLFKYVWKNEQLN